MNNLYEELKKNINPEKLKNINKEYLDEELYYLECNPEDIEYLLSLKNIIKQKNEKLPNTLNSTVYYLLDLTDDLPKTGIERTETTMPDIDYDTDAREEIKEYLNKKYGEEHVTLIGTYQALKTKGALSDIIRSLGNNKDSSVSGENKISFDDIKKLTKKFDIIKRLETDQIKEALIASENDYSWVQDHSSEIAFFFACLESDPTLKEWFEKHADVKERLENILGNVKTTGIHAGGIIVSKLAIPDVSSLNYDHDEKMYITQADMTNVESMGLIKYDFLGLKTLVDLRLARELVNARHGTNYTFLPKNNMDMKDKEVLKLFSEGKTESVFQFNTPLATGILTQLQQPVESIIDLAIITSIARPGPLKMGMDKTFIERKNTGIIEYLHPTLESILNESYGILCFQESVIQIAKKVGLMDDDDSVTFMKALSKKKADKVKKYVDQLIENAISVNGYTKEKAETLYDLLFAFSQYGFNKSHAVAYACVSYLCMWFKHYYPAEWICAVLSNAEKDDFKILYPKWKSYILTPDVNLSKSKTFHITDDNKVMMPLNKINNVGEKIADSITLKQPFNSFEDFLKKVPNADKSTVLALIWSGAFDSFKPDMHYAESKWRKELAIKYYTKRANGELLKIDSDGKMIDGKKITGKELEKINVALEEISKMNRGHIMMEEISLLNFTSFDYYSYFYKYMTDGSKKYFRREAMRIEDAKELPNNTPVIIGGGIESIKFVIQKSGKNKGKEMARIVVSNEDQTVDVTVFAADLERDDKTGNSKIRSLKEQSAVIMKGKVNIFNGRFGIIYEECIVIAAPSKK